MTTITGMTLDFDKMLEDKWAIYFNSGVYQNINQLITTEPVIMRLNMEDYQV